MAKRHRDALAIQEGACNPSGIALAIVDACKEVRSETGTPTHDPAIRLMVHQLAYICGVDEINDGLSVYSRLADACQAAGREEHES